MNNDIQLLHGDCVELLSKIPDASIDAVLTDPPYQYIKNHKLDIPFDETRFFTEIKRVLKDGGFIVMFGRGTAFYRWNTQLADLDFTFKEEIIWNKNQITSPVSQFGRMHETISIHSKGKGVINKTRVPYLERNAYDFDLIIDSIRRLKNILTNADALNAVQQYINAKKIDYTRAYQSQNDNICMKKGLARCDAAVSAYKAMHEGCIERSIIKMPRVKGNQLHPTQKPVKLIERLLALVTKENAVVLDTFAGSGSTGVACINTARRFIGMELDAAYFSIAQQRIKKAYANRQQELFEAGA